MTDQAAPAVTGTPAPTDAGRLAGIAARERAATAGPWSTEGPGQPGILKNADGRRILGVFGGRPQDEADAEFTAHARLDVPFLLDRDAAHTRRTAHLERALAAVTDFAHAADVVDANGTWDYGYRAARHDLLDILRTTQPGVTAVPAGTALFLAEYKGADPELYTSLEAAKDHCAAQLAAENPGKSWDWLPEEGGSYVQVYTDELDDRPLHHGPGTVQRIIVRPDPHDAEPGVDDLPHPYAEALTTDTLGRPVCDGTRHRATRNCEDRAVFQLLYTVTKKVEGYACASHLGQMVSTVNGGEHGSVLTRQIAIKE
ncbi:hypothetical protein [Streptomyces sp. AC1-42T]|uniref:hypothetical protein n=1 Tax=Streptomyces sp. AC1-42T TaxID=2218665 RepID=UPI000DB23795|nr:hypothetical protein [Streptomyces sp. AC1-42T]PZT71564.1 hypothetical protein DNK55_33200 [Streptomyces sp. AC1-42T]